MNLSRFAELDKKNLDTEYLTECFCYDETSGKLMWKKRPASHFSNGHEYKRWNTRYSGKVSGWEKDARKGKNKKPYISLRINHRTYYAHVIIAIITGIASKDEIINRACEIDHIDGNGTNNNIENLRKVSPEENCKNKRIRSDNKSGKSGVSFHKISGKWVSRINVNKKRLTIGFFVKLEDAIRAREEAEKIYGYHKNHGSDRPL